MKKNLKFRRGMSLLEVMIVLVILVGLMALVGPRLLGTQQKADRRQAQLQVGNVVSALKLYAADMRGFPTTEEGLELLVSAPEDEDQATNWDGPYLEDGKLPVDPWGSEIGYEYESAEAGGDSLGADSTASSSNTSYDFPRVFSNGPDRQAGTDDDIANRSADGEEEMEKEKTSKE